MLYANGINANEYAGLLGALAEIGIDEETLAAAAAYLDMSKPMDNTLLDGIKTRDIMLRIGYQEREKIRKYVDREILRSMDIELIDRYTLLVHAIAGSTCAWLTFFGKGLTEESQRLRALKKRFGTKAYAVDLAIQMEWISRAGWASPLRFVDSDTLWEAMEYCTAELPRAKLMFCTYILSLAPTPEKKKGIAAIFGGTQSDPRIEKILAYLAGLWNNVRLIAHDQRSIQYLVLASAAGARFSDFLTEKVGKSIQPNLKDVMEIAFRLPVPKKHIFNAIAETPAADTPEYISRIAFWTNGKSEDFNDGQLLRDLAVRYPETYMQALIRSTEDPALSLVMEKIMKEADPNRPASEYSISQLSKARCVQAISEDYPDQEDAIVSYLCGEAEIASLLPLAPQMVQEKYVWNRKSVNYVAAFGLDDFAKRCICVQALATNGLTHYGGRTPGYEIKQHEKELVSILREGGVPFPYIFKCASEIIEGAPTYNDTQTEMRDKFCTAFSECTEEVVSCDVKQMNVMGRSMYLEIIGKQPESYRAQILALADNSSKAIRAELAAYLKEHPEWTSELLTLLKAKKAAKRELAVEVLKAFDDLSAHREELQAAFEAEKKADLKQKLAVMLGEECPAEAAAESAADLITDLTKGNKAKKVQWLFETPFAPVRKIDGSPAETAHLQAILLCYANMTNYGVSDMANGLAEQLNQKDLAAFALEVLGKWLEQGAAAKQKWVLYAAALHGGYEAQTTLLHYIKEWSEHARGAIAAEAVRAIAFKGTSEALMAVDNMARKFKNRQVRSAAAMALEQAAAELNITTEELADRIVPNLGFDENLCREFDYGTRKFKVYLTPALELEIFEGEKKLKNLPKPGAKDDAETAEASSKAFKEMKKQMKAVITAQKQRLEYVLMCHRTWTAQGWQELFVKNPVMHCFAIGLIWGTYDENGTLLETFRYMEDGTFNTADEDEFELSETAVIGLVHPIELDEETRSAWQEQLEDYEITQPFPQMQRTIHTIQEDERKSTDILRFEDYTLNSLSLLGRMQKYGWDKGVPQDAGMFYEFTRTDIIRREKDAEGKVKLVGNSAELVFSGMYAGGYENEDVTIEKVQFFRLDSTKPVLLSEVDPRYFSEVMLQLSAALAGAAAPNETK